MGIASDLFAALAEDREERVQRAEPADQCCEACEAWSLAVGVFAEVVKTSVGARDEVTV